MSLVLAKIEADNLKSIAVLRHNPEFKDKPITISRIQWHLKMGYNMASHLLNNAIEDGILIRNKNTPSAALFSDKGCFHSRCNDCGIFLKKERWVDKANKHKYHALCSSCLSDYDCTECDNTM